MAAHADAKGEDRGEMMAEKMSGNDGRHAAAAGHETAVSRARRIVLRQSRDAPTSCQSVLKSNN